MSDTATGAAAPKPDERLAYRGVFQRALIRPEIGAAIGAVFIWVFFWAVSVKFGEASGASSILDVAASPLGIMAVAVALLMIGGEFDLSSGAATGALGILTILLVRDVAGGVAGAGFSLWVALPISLLAALGLGWWNGFLVNRTSLPSFIVTLGSFFVLKGAKLGFSKLIVDQIQVGKLDDLAINAEENGVSDKGYGFLDSVFAGEWIRNDHIWEGRDWFYMIGIIGGLSLIVMAVYELHFRRKETFNPAGLGAFVAGVVVALVGINRLHATDSTGGNTMGAIIIGVGLLVGTLGWCMWRYAASPSSADGLIARVENRSLVLAAIAGLALTLVVRIVRADDVGGYFGDDRWFLLAAALSVVTLGLTLVAPPRVDADSPSLGYVVPLVLGLAGLVGAIIIAQWLDAQNGEDLTVAFDWLTGGWTIVLGLLLAVVASIVSVRSDIQSGFEVVDIFLGEARNKIVSAVIVSMLFTFAFVNLATEQGARAILFVGASILSVIGFASAISRVRRAGGTLATGLLIASALALVVMAFFIRDESLDAKFRSQAFSVMLALAALIAVWALANSMFEVRRFPDGSADKLGRNLLLIAALAIAVGIVSRLMWVTQAELDAGLNQTKFSVRILWFLGFTAVVSWVLARTKFGSWTFAVGGNKQAARQVGVPAARTKTQLFMVVSAAAWLVGVLLAFRLNTIQASTGDGEEFEYIIAAVVGGTALTGGYGSTIGAGIGALIMAMAVQGIPSARWNSDWRFVFVGAILLLAVVANNYIRTKAESAR